VWDLGLGIPPAGSGEGCVKVKMLVKVGQSEPTATNEPTATSAPALGGLLCTMEWANGCPLCQVNCGWACMPG